MFNPSLVEVRNFFFNIWDKAKHTQELTDLEKIAYSIILEHPEYHYILEDRVQYLEFEWTPEMGQTNPFLHLSMHLTILEQLSIDQPAGVKQFYQELCNKESAPHQAQHALMECVGEMLWQANANATNLDVNVYFNCIKYKLGKSNVSLL